MGTDLQTKSPGESGASFLFVNPASGSYSAERLREVLRALAANGYEPMVFETRTPDQIAERCTLINRTPDPLVIVAAGDGTVNCVVNGLEVGSGATIAVLPFGTSNVLAAELGIDSVSTGLARIAAGTSQWLSIGLLELERVSRRFVLMAGIGLDGAVVRDVRPGEKRRFKQGAYALSALRHACAWDPATFEVITPDGRFTCHSAIICNGSRYGGNFALASGRTLFSTGFEIVLIPACRRRDYLGLAFDLFSNRGAESGRVIRCCADTIEFSGTKAIQLDGDFVGHGPGRLSQLDRFAKIIT